MGNESYGPEWKSSTLIWNPETQEVHALTGMDETGKYPLLEHIKKLKAQERQFKQVFYNMLLDLSGCKHYLEEIERAANKLGLEYPLHESCAKFDDDRLRELGAKECYEPGGNESV